MFKQHCMSAVTQRGAAHLGVQPVTAVRGHVCLESHLQCQQKATFANKSLQLSKDHQEKWSPRGNLSLLGPRNQWIGNWQVMPTF